jgi:hypothetical protein
MTYELATQLFEYKDGILYWKKGTKNTYKGKPVSPSLKRKYLQVKHKNKVYYIHRIVFLLCNGYLPKYIDHINQNKHDNRIENLRECNYFQNMANTKGWKSKSLPKGVSKNGNNFNARIMYMGKQYNLGTFKSIEEAQNIYINKSKELLKEFSPYHSFA